MTESEKFWNANKSILLSRAMVYLFAAAVIAVDIAGPWVCRWLVTILPHTDPSFSILLGCLYVCSIPAFLLLYSMHRLLRNLQKGMIFTPENVKLLRAVSYCCFCAGLVCLCCSFCFPSLLIVTLAAGFVGLIVRIVKNVFQQAIEMKDELDLTV